MRNIRTGRLKEGNENMEGGYGRLTEEMKVMAAKIDGRKKRFAERKMEYKRMMTGRLKYEHGI